MKIILTNKEILIVDISKIENNDLIIEYDKPPVRCKQVLDIDLIWESLDGKSSACDAIEEFYKVIASNSPELTPNSLLSNKDSIYINDFYEKNHNFPIGNITIIDNKVKIKWNEKELINFVTDRLKGKELFPTPKETIIYLRDNFKEIWEDCEYDIDFSKYTPITSSNSLHVNSYIYEINNDKYRATYAIGNDTDKLVEKLRIQETILDDITDEMLDKAYQETKKDILENKIIDLLMEAEKLDKKEFEELAESIIDYIEKLLKN